jgi:hypothetical protein
MALPDLTGQNIQDTFQRILQKSGSGQVTDGTGSLVPLLKVTASYADLANNAIGSNVATSAKTIAVDDNENSNENNLITFIANEGSTGYSQLNSDGDFHYNPSTGTVTAPAFKGDIDAVNGDFDGTLEADAITVGGTSLNDVITGTTVTNATNATHISVADNENTDENNLITFIENASATGNVGLESDGDFHYNPSTGKVTATQFDGLIDGGTF